MKGLWSITGEQEFGKSENWILMFKYWKVCLTLLYIKFLMKYYTSRVHVMQNIQVFVRKYYIVKFIIW